MKWSHYQQAIFEAFEFTGDSLIINAVAGSGKTTVLVHLAEIAARVFPHLRIIFMAFNKGIMEELNARFKALGITNCVAITLHSAGWAAWRRAGGMDWQPRLDQHKVSGIIRQCMSWEERKRWEETTRKLVGFAKGVGLVPSTGWSINPYSLGISGLVDDTPEAWDALIEHYNLDPDECNIDWVRKVLARSIETARDTCDYDDMLFQPVISGVPFERYDVVLVDEAQDVSGIQMEMIGRMVAPRCALTVPAGPYEMPGRVIGVGDRSQAIYGFRGAGTDSMDLMRERFGMRELPLSVSYRCPRSVVEHARQWVPQIEWREDAEDGIVLEENIDHARQAGIALEGVSKWGGIEDFKAGDALLCRLNRPLVAAAFALIRRRIACRVLGREIGAGLVALVKKPKFDATRPVSDWEAWAGAWFLRERERLVAKRQFAAVGNLEDRLATVAVFIEELLERNAARCGNDPEIAGVYTTIGELIQSIDDLFRDRGPEGMVTLATVHKAKGLEWSRVFILDAGELMPVPWGRQGGWEAIQEKNCQYIAATRAQRELRYITSAVLGIARRER